MRSLFDCGQTRNGFMHGAAFEILPFVSEPFGQNAYVVRAAGRTDCVVIDPGFEPELILQHLADANLTVAAVLNTHGHVDHIAGNRAVKEAFPNAPLAIGPVDAPMLQDPDLNLSSAFGLPVTSPHKDVSVVHDGVLEYAGLTFDCWDCPGHTPGHVVFSLRRPGQAPAVFAGDTLFRESLGRGDFPGGDFRQLVRSVRAVYWRLPDDTAVYPGHGDSTTVGHEKKHNPFAAAGHG
jgi:hydroxyacylglutathione hydrolase